MNDKEIKYTIQWTQTYLSPLLHIELDMLEQAMEAILIASEYKEALEVINRIKNKL